MSNNGSLRVVPSVFTLIEKDGKFLLLRRANTGYMDGWWDVPAGHLENEEKLKDGALRELKEEVGLSAKAEDLRLVHVYQNHTGPQPHYGYIFYAQKWSGEPKIMEIDKCDGLEWFATDNLPKNLLPYTRQAILNFNSGDVEISYHAPNSINP